jgi:NAD(P)-dependent dehydrogenase (short-subunit alcohol dehydrogenase family)
MMPEHEAGTSSLCVVAGATGRIGGAIVSRLLGEGYSVLGVARSGSSLATAVERFGPRFTALLGDVTDDAVVEGLASAVAGREVRAVVSCVRAPDVSPLEVALVEDLVACVDIKAGGLLRLVRGVDAGLRSGSRVIAIGGRFAWQPDPERPGSGIANAALHNLVRQLAVQYAARGVTCHAVAPGKVLPEGRPEDVTPQSIAWFVSTLLDPEAAPLSGAALPFE